MTNALVTYLVLTLLVQGKFCETLGNYKILIDKWNECCPILGFVIQLKMIF